MYESRQALIKRIKKIKNLREQFDMLWKLRMGLSAISDFSGAALGSLFEAFNVFIPQW